MFERTLKESTRVLHVVAACWMFLLAFAICADVFGRWLFNTPLTGTAEIVANSVVAVVFLQIPFAIRTRAMLHTTVILESVSTTVRRYLAIFGYVLGMGFFLTLGFSSWDLMVTAWETREYFGEGALRVPSGPTRTIIFVMGFVSALAYLLLIVKELAGQGDESSESLY